jgi:hydrogenase maturation protein HypF
MGGELKNTFCLASGRHAWASQHIGDMGSLETLAAFERSTRQFNEMYQIDPLVIAADAHPGYQTRRWADEQERYPVEVVQHHHGHIASVMVEHAVPMGEKVIGFAFDGTGYGIDGAIWGGEVLIADYAGFERSAHLRYVPLPGGDATIRKPYRAALAHLWAAGLEWADDLPPVQAASEQELNVLRRQLERNIQCVAASSMGRLFDSVSSLLGVRHCASYEAQAAIELEWIAGDHVRQARPYQFGIANDEMDPTPVLRALIDDARGGCAVGAMAAGFHAAVARLIAEIADRLREKTGIEKIALSGGVFQNVLLLGMTRSMLEERHLLVLTHRVVPPNDGGLALGQAAIAGHRAMARARQ